MRRFIVGLLSFLIIPILMSCIAQKSVGLTFTENGKGVGIYSGLVDKTATNAPATVSSIINTIGAAVTVLEFTIKENGSRDGYPLQIRELRFTNLGTADTADLRFVLEGPGSNNTIGTNNGNVVTFKDFGDLIVADGDTVGKTYQVKVHIRSNIQGSLADNNTVILKTSPVSDFTVVETSSNILESVSAFQSNATTVTVTATHLQGKNSFNSLTANATQDFPGSQSIYATDENGRIDTDFTEVITLSPHTTICPNAAAGTLSSGEAGDLTHNAVAGIATWGDLKYSQAGTIRIRAVSTTITAADKWLCSAQIVVN